MISGTYPIEQELSNPYDNVRKRIVLKEVFELIYCAVYSEFAIKILYSLSCQEWVYVLTDM